jgi:hypothetical protein
MGGGQSAVQAKVDSFAEAAAANGKSFCFLTPEHLLALFQQAGGGLAAGNTALAASMVAQTRTIESLTAEAERLLKELAVAHRRIGELERSDLEREQWKDRYALSKHHLDHEAKQSAEMLGLVKGIGMLALAHWTGQGGSAAAVASMFGGGLPGVPGAPGAGGPFPGTPPAAAPRAAAPPVGAPVASGAAGEAPGGRAAPAGEVRVVDAEFEPSDPPAGERRTPTPTADLLREMVMALTPSTIERVLTEAERPNPQLPNNTQTLMTVLQILLGGLDPATIELIESEVGSERMVRLKLLMIAMAQGRGAPGVG